MSLQRLAPQAYTKETLIKAFEWLQSQDDSIKSVATSVDALISLYMKAKLQGEESLHRLSIKNFKNDLQNLASIVGDWDRSAGATTKSSSPASAAADGPGRSALSADTISRGQGVTESQSSSPVVAHHAAEMWNGPYVPHESGLASSTLSSSGLKMSASHNSKPRGTTSASLYPGGSDMSSLLPPELERELSELTRSLHLSHRDEALRMALRIGIEQLKKLL